MKKKQIQKKITTNKTKKKTQRHLDLFGTVIHLDLIPTCHHLCAFDVLYLFHLKIIQFCLKHVW